MVRWLWELLAGMDHEDVLGLCQKLGWFCLFPKFDCDCLDGSPQECEGLPYTLVFLKFGKRQG